MVKNEKNALEKFFLLSQFSKKKKTKQNERKTKTFLYYYKIVWPTAHDILHNAC